MENHINRTRMILYIQPVAHILTLTIHRQWLAMTDIIDEQRNPLLRELIRTIIIGAVCHNGRHTISIMKSPHKMITTCLAGRIRTMGLVFSLLRKECTIEFQSTINLICRNMIKTLTFITFRKCLPSQLCSLEQRESPHHIRLGKCKRIFYTTVYMTFSSQVNNSINVILLEDF